MIVVDASVAVGWFLPEPNANIARQLLDGTHQLAVPDFIALEIASVLLRATRRGAIPPDAADDSRTRLAEMELDRVPATALLDSAWTITRQHGGSIYDAIYVALALKLDASLVSADAGMIRVATAAGVRCGLLAEGLPPPA